VPQLLLSAVKSHGVICKESNLRERKMRGAGRHEMFWAGILPQEKIMYVLFLPTIPIPTYHRPYVG
jgi:hypothetical protein